VDQREHHTSKTEQQRMWVLWAPGLIVALGAAVATAHGLYEVAAASQVPHALALLYPLITDGLALVAYASTARLSGSGRGYAWFVVVLAAGLSGLAQAAFLAGGVSTAPTMLRFGVGAWPAIAAAIAAHLLYLIAADHRAKLAKAEQERRAAAEQARLDAEARERAEAKRRDEAERREQRRAERTAASTRPSTRRQNKASTPGTGRPVQASTGTPADPVPATSTRTGTDTSTELSTPASTGLHLVGTDRSTEPGTRTGTDTSTAGQWDQELWDRAVSTARQYRREHGSDARVDDFQNLGIGRNRAADLRRAVLASGQASTDPSTHPVPAAGEAT
jgi:hypothetical protein